ncbi:HlyD family type I secretion periplasmic adaptor subunit [Massilia sp. METH4]|uniref:HlyD family type I secretion periplasmic adaptor subunit n=1 Tax=Massilia sp. METH4 TaxID=3123041 RepID=UPI0030D5B1AC
MSKFPHRTPPLDLSEFTDARDVLDARLPASYRGLQYAIAGLTLAAFVWACVVETDVVASAPGRIVPDGHVKTIQAPETAIVRSIHVKDGSLTRRGDLLVTFDPSVSNADVGAMRSRHELLRFEIARVEAEIAGTVPVYPPLAALTNAAAVQEELRRAHAASMQAKLRQADTELDNARQNRLAQEQALTFLEQSRAAAAEQEARFRPYVGQAIPMVTYVSTKETLLSKERELISSREKLNASGNDIRNLEEKRRLLIEENRAQLFAELYAKRAEATTLAAELEKALRAQRIKELRAPVDGFVQQVGVNTLGAVVAPGQNLISIVPSEAPIVVEGLLSSADVGFAKEGQEVTVKVDAYPFMQYGGLKGKLEWISPDAESSSDKTKPQSGGYRIRASLMQRSLHDASTLALKPGMTVVIDVKTDRRKFIQLFFQPMLRYWKDAAQQR